MRREERLFGSERTKKKGCRVDASIQGYFGTGVYSTRDASKPPKAKPRQPCDRKGVISNFLPVAEFLWGEGGKTGKGTSPARRKSEGRRRAERKGQAGKRLYDEVRSSKNWSPQMAS